MKNALLLLLLIQSLVMSQNDKGAISGNLRSLDGSPAIGIRVAAVPVSETKPLAPTAEISSLGQTDSSGNFRLENLQPGRYRVFAGLVDSPTYFPGVTAAGSGTIVSVTAGSTVTGINFAMVRSAGTKVSGRVTKPESSAPSALPGRVALLPRTANNAVGILNVDIQTDRTFEFANVLPGTYSVMASVANSRQKEPVTIAVDTKDVMGIELVLLSTQTTTTLKGLEQVWSFTGQWGGITSDEKAGILYATKPGARVDLDAAGKTLRETPFPAAVILKRAMFANGPAFLAFGTWSPAVNAYDEQGKLLWSYPPALSTGIDDAAAIDLDGDGNEEVIVGFNGGTGVHVLNSRGEVIWKSTAIGNVWHVAAGDLRGDGKPQIITTSAAGQIHIFSDDGSDRRNILPGFYAHMIRVGKLSDKDATVTIFAAGAPPAGKNALRLAAIASDGAQKWATDLPDTTPSSDYSASLASGKPWIAFGLGSGQVFVLDATNGTILGSVDGQGSTPELAWVADKDTGNPLLVVSSRTSLRAYRVKQP